MPSVSSKQHNAMEAAAHGHSTLGIPKSVGQDFANADKGKRFSRGGAVHDRVYPGQEEEDNEDTAEARQDRQDTQDRLDITDENNGQNYDAPLTRKNDRTPSLQTGRYNKLTKNFEAGGAIGVMPTMGVSSAYPAPPGKRSQGPRNYGKK